MAVLAMHHCSVIVNNTNDSLAFYQGVLGLELDSARPDLGYPGAWLNVGQQQIHLLELPNPDSAASRPLHGGRDRHMALLVDDLQQLIQALDNAGIAYSLSKSGRKALFCRDPDANAVECIEQIKHKS
ncbi:MAG: VOC family protein [Gammaproteobacteria bacterium]|nr:VOC family protein [Gammaproteobacteria bacterium]